jgi:hypothetical protein
MPFKAFAKGSKKNTPEKRIFKFKLKFKNRKKTKITSCNSHN